MILQRQSGLGRGLGALIPPKGPAKSPASAAPEEGPFARAEPDVPSGERVLQIPVGKIDPNPHQPRAHFDHAQLEDLITSVKEHGVIQPLVVTTLPNGRYQLIVGERRLRAATIAGLETVPAIVRTATEQQKLELALIENVQRADLNPIEEARAYVRLMEEFGLTQEQVGERVGKSRPQVGNLVRLLQLPQEIQQALRDAAISASNARTLLSLPTEAERMELFQQMLAGPITVRQAEERVYRPRQRRPFDANLAAAEDRLRDKLKTKVTIKRDASGKGEIKIAFASDEELGSILSKLENA